MRVPLLFVVFLVFMQSCGLQEDVKTKTYEKNNDFKHVFEVSCKQVELPSVVEIMHWYLDDTMLYCTSTDTELFFYIFSLSDFSLVESFGRKGQGPDDYLFPQMILSQNKKYILDDGKRKLYCVSNQKAKESIPYKSLDVPSDFKFYKYPLGGYMNFNPREVSWKFYDIETNVVKDSILYLDETNKGLALQQHEFFWDFGGQDEAVLASLYKDQYTVVQISNDTIEQIKVYKGNGSSISESFNGYSTSKMYYGDVECTENYIFLLSHKNQNRSSGIGSTEVEVYDFRGNPVCLMKLNIYAQHMLLDKAYNRLLLLSPDDDYVYVAELPKSIDWKNY